MTQNAAIAAIATPPGKGGICCVRISGEGAHEIGDKIFRAKNAKKTIANAAGYTALFGHFEYKNRVQDEAIALVFRAPKSYTGEDTVEISCHGGTAVAKTLLSACIAAGAQPAGPGEFTKRAFLNGKISLTQAEAVAQLISATSAQGAAAAAAALDGALHKAINTSCIAPLVQVLAHVAAYTDFPDEGVEDLPLPQLTEKLAGVHAALEKRINEYEKGAILRRGVNTAIVGRPNAGKSTLLNLLAGYEKAIVTPTPGTTRDVVEEAVSVGGIELVIADTAGLRQTQDEIEREGIRRAYARMETAGLIIAVFDGGCEITDEDIALAQRCENRAALAVLNKSDLEQKFDFARIENCFTRSVVLTANAAEFHAPLESAIIEVLGVKDIDPDAGLLASERQLFAATRAKDAVADALDALEQGFSLDVAGVCMDDALAALYELTGEKVSEEVVGELFETFCVGK